MTDYGIDVEAVTTDGKTVTLYSISPFEEQNYVAARTTRGSLVLLDAEEAKRVRRTANKSDRERDTE